MESSSSDSFLWTDASNESADNRRDNYRIITIMEAHSKEESGYGVNSKQKMHHTNLKCENEIKKKQRKTKKRKYTEVSQEESHHSPERKIIKLEPESDIDIEKKKKLGKENNLCNIKAEDSDLYHEEISDLNLQVKQEQISSVQIKKKKKQERLNSNTDTACDSEFTTDPNKESYLDLRVKQEQASKIIPGFVKSKKKKKREISEVSSDMDIANDTMSITTLSQADSSTFRESIGYTIIEEKFSADETMVEKPRKKKHKTDAISNHTIDDDNKSTCVKNKTEITLEVDNDYINNNDMSLEASDFTCKNVVSSTIINSTAIDSGAIQLNQTAEFLGYNKNIFSTKISDRIRFEEDDNSSQQSPLNGKTPAKVNMFMKVNPHLKLCASETPKDSLITKDDEIWTLAWPHEINHGKLKSTTLSFDGKCKIKIDEQTYEGVQNEDVLTITLLTHEYGQAFIKNVRVKSSIDYHKRIPKVHIPNNNIMVNNQNNFTPLPETKCRHPLFGAHYKKAIKISTAVAERLQTAKGRYSDTSAETINKKKHKKNKHKSLNIKVEEECVCVKPEYEKYNNHKCNQQTNGRPKKSKCFKNITDSPAVWESEKAIEENLFNF